MAAVRTMIANQYEGLRLCRHYGPGGGWLEVLDAEPRALFVGTLLRSLRRGDGMPEVYVDYPGVGGTLHIQARNRTVVYRLVAQEDPDLFVGEWSD